MYRRAEGATCSDADTVTSKHWADSGYVLITRNSDTGDADDLWALCSFILTKKMMSAPRRLILSTVAGEGSLLQEILMILGSTLSLALR
jgi:hypothetical protein